MSKDYDEAFANSLGASKPENAYDAAFPSFPTETAKATKPTIDPRDRTGVFDAAMIGAGRTFNRMGAGLQQMYYAAKGDEAGLSRLKDEQDEAKRLMAPLEKDRPFATAIGASLPLMAIPVGGAGATAAGMAGRAALGGAIPEALSYGSVEERARNAALAGAGGAAGGLVGYGTGKAIQKFGQGMAHDPAQVIAAEKLRSMGVPVRPDQATGNHVLQNMNAAFDNLPTTAGAQQEFRRKQTEALNNLVGRSINQTGPLDDAARIAAKDAIGRGYTEVALNNQIPAPRLEVALNAMEDLAKESASPRVNNLVRFVYSKMDENTGVLSGKAYKEIDSKLGKSMTGGTDAHYIRLLRDELRDAMRASVRPQDAGKWEALDKQYAALGAISKSVDEAGDVSARKLYSATRGKDITRASRGDLGEIASLAKGVIPDPVGNSGTGQRFAYQNWLMGQGLLGGGLGAAAYYGTGDPNMALAGLLLPSALPVAARAIANNPTVANMLLKQRYQMPDAARSIGGLLGTGAGYGAPGLLYPAIRE